MVFEILKETKMNTKKKGFTLVELLVVVAVAAILLMIATDRFVGDSFRANATYNQRVDVQTGVKTSMDNVKSILKRSVQVHLVGKEVYKEDMDLSKLDNKYNYIGFRYDGHGNRFLANIVYDKAKGQFDVLPLTAGDKKDIMTGDKISYNLEFYKNDSNYKDKLDKDIISMTITGKSSANVLGKGIQDEYVLKEDIQLPNVNQILLSRHLQGGVDKITALAYDNGLIQPGRKGSSGKIGFVFIIDSSSSMKLTMVNPRYPTNSSDPYAYVFKIGSVFKISHSQNIRDLYKWKVYDTVYSRADIEDGDDKKGVATRKVILGHAMTNNFLPKVHELAVSKGLEIESYIFDYNNQLAYYTIDKDGNYERPKDRWRKSITTGKIAEPSNYSAKYFTTLDMAKERNYGPFKLETNDGLDKAINLIENGIGMKYDEKDHTVSQASEAYGEGTNTGFGMLTGLEILKQMKDEGVENRFFVLLTDGIPSGLEYILPSGNPAVSRSVYNSQGGTSLNVNHSGEYSGISYIDQITNADNGNNPKGLYKKAYLIGLSGIDSELARVGLPDASGNVDRYSIKACLEQTGNTAQVYKASDKNALNDALESIVKDIGVSMGVFDGPDKMK